MCSEDLIPKLTEMSNMLLESSKRRGYISEKQLKYFRFDFKKACNLGKLYLLLKIDKRMFNIPVCLLSPIVVHLLKTFLNLWTVIFNQS